MNWKGALEVFREKAVAVSYKASEITGHTIYGTAMVDWLKGRSGQYISTGYAGNDTVYAVVRVLLDKIVEGPLILNEEKDEKAAMRYKSIRAVDDYKLIQHKLCALKAFDEITKDPIIDLLDNPNEYQSKIEFWEAFWGWYITYGDAYVFTLTPGQDSRNAGQPISMHIVPASIVTKEYRGDVWAPKIRYIFTLRGVKFDLGQDEIFNLSRWNPTTLMPYGDGLSPMQPGGKSIVKNELNIEAQAAAYKNGGGVWLLSGDPTKGALTPPQMDAMKLHIMDQIKGASNNGNKVFTNGFVNAQKVGDSIADMELIAADSADRVKIATMFGVDPILVGDKSASSYNNAQEAYKGLVRNVVVAALNKRDVAFSKWLIPKFGASRKVLVTDISYYSELQPDYAIVSQYVSNPKLILKTNEIRALFGFDAETDPLFDRAVIPSGFVFYDELAMPTGDQADADIEQAINKYNVNG